MINLTDELLNKYIDNELDRETYHALKEQLKKSPDDLRKLNEFQKIHFELKNIKEDEIGLQFTSNVMEKIRKKAKFKQSDKYFIISISSFILLIIFILFGVVISQLINFTGTSSTFSVSDNISNYANKLTGIINSIFTTKGISIFGTIISLGLIISIYTFYENHKKTKDSLSKLH
jgi:anti-sigma factor RsiW